MRRLINSPQRMIMGLILTSILVLAAANAQGLAAQSGGEQMPGPPPRHPTPRDLPMQSNLFDAEQLAQKTEMLLPQLASALRDRGFVADDQGQILVEIVGPVGGEHVSAQIVEHIGGDINFRVRSH